MTTDRTLDIKTGRHPSVEIALQDSLNSFTPNDTYMDDKAYINAIFGPNMVSLFTLENHTNGCSNRVVNLLIYARML